MAVGISILLGISSTEQLCQFLHSCIDSLVGKTSTTPLNNMSCEFDWSQEDYEQARKLIKNVYKKAVSIPDYNIEDKISELGAEKVMCIKECYEIRKPEIHQAITNECLAKMDVPLVTDYDWKLKWVIGSSALSSVREPLLQMDFHTTKMDQDDIVLNNITNFEMNIYELNNFIDQIEKSLI